MKISRKFRLGLLVFIPVFGILSIGCFGGFVDRNLNGTWVSNTEEVELKLNNGVFEETRSMISIKGTYTTKNNLMTRTLTHYDANIFFGSQPDKDWILKNDISKTIKRFFPGEDINEEEIKELENELEEEVTEMFELNIPTAYTVDGITLTIAVDGERTQLTKKN
jgi:hypothetical protein